MEARDMSGNGTVQYRNAEELLPYGELLEEIRGTDCAIRAIYLDSIFYDRQHWWVAHTPDGREEFIGVKRNESQVSVNSGTFEDALAWLSIIDPDDGTLVSKETVPIEQTPIPYHRDGSVMIECPECDNFATAHSWKVDQQLEQIDECACGYGGDFDVEPF